MSEWKGSCQGVQPLRKYSLPPSLLAYFRLPFGLFQTLRGIHLSPGKSHCNGSGVIPDLAPIGSSAFIHPGPASVASWLFSSVSRAHSLTESLGTSCPPCLECSLPTHLHGSLCHLVPCNIPQAPSWRSLCS